MKRAPLHEGHRRAAVPLLLAGALALLLWGLLGLPQAPARWLLLVDRSLSMPRGPTEAAAAEVMGALGAANVARIDFAGQPAAAGSGPDDALRPAATDVEAALQAALAAEAAAPLSGVVVVSDGRATQGDAAAALRALQAAGVPVAWRALGRAAPSHRLGAVLAPGRVAAGEGFELQVAVEGEAGAALRMRARARSESGALQERSAEVQAGQAWLHFDGFGGGAVVADLVLEDAADGRVLDRRRDAALVPVQARARLLVAQGTPGPLAASLVRGGWPVRVVPAARLEAELDALPGYAAVVLDDVAVDDAPPRWWAALGTAVRERGLGLVVLGGERSFAAGGYRGSALEALMPLQAEPPADDARAAVMFMVDKSGSMGQGAGGVDRFAMAQRAVAETAAALGERDAAGLLVFDVQPRLLQPLQAGTREALRGDWPVRPGGGTRLAPALEAAIAQLEAAPAARRLLVLVSDGFTEAGALPALRARLAQARIEAVALAVGADADVPALQRLFGHEPGTVLRVNEAAELPSVMVRGVERARARIARGEVAVEQVAPLPFAPGRFEAWPPVAAHAAVRAAPGASVLLRSAGRGEALLATTQVGRGRVAALASGLGAWTPRWLGWAGWPPLAAGLAGWAAGGDGAGLRVSLEAGGAAVRIEGDFGAALPAAWRLALDTPAGAAAPPRAEWVAPGRARLRLPEAGPGVYTLHLATPQGAGRWPLLRAQADEESQFGLAPELQAWREAGWLSDWDSAATPARGRALPAPPGLRRGPLAAALGLVGLALVLERWRVLASGWRRARAAFSARGWRRGRPQAGP